MDKVFEGQYQTFLNCVKYGDCQRASKVLTKMEKICCPEQKPILVDIKQALQAIQ